MKFTLYLLGWLLFSFSVAAQEKKTFSAREKADIKVPTPGLFDKSNKHVWLLDLMTEKDYAFPLPGAKVISPYGSHHRSNHTGMDIKTCAKDTIRCAFNGVVRLSRSYGGYGNVVVVRHPHGIETIYSHNFVNFVKVGDVMKAGQPIGLTGRTGRATTEHLHFETRINGHHFNPNLLFNMKEQTLHKGKLHSTNHGRSVTVKRK